MIFMAATLHARVGRNRGKLRGAGGGVLLDAVAA